MGDSRSTHFTIFESAPPENLQREVRDHVAATGLPETFPGLHRGPLSKDEEHVILCPVSVPRDKRPNQDRAPCPMCQPNKFYDGRLVYLPNLKAAAVIGNECAAGSRAAEAEYKRRLAIEAAQDFLIDTLPTVAARLKLAAELSPAAVECDRFHAKFRRDGAYFVKALRKASRGAGQLTVTEVIAAIAGGPAGMRTSGSTTQTRDIAFGRLAGGNVVAGQCTIVSDLEGQCGMLQAVAGAATQEDALERVVAMPEEDRPLAAAAVKRAFEGIAAAEAAITGFRAFLSPANLERISAWGGHVANETPMRAELRAFGHGKGLLKFQGPSGKHCPIVVETSVLGVTAENAG